MQLNAFTTSLIAATIINGVLAYYTWQRRPSRGSTEFFILLIAITQWSFFAIFEASAKTIFYKTLFSVITYIGITAVPVMLLLFAFRYVGIDSWINKKNVTFLFILPIISFLMACTNHFHGLLWSDISVGKSAFAGIYGTYSHGPWFWINAVYSYIIVLIAILVLLVTMIRAKHLYLLQSRVLIFSSAIPLIANLVYALSPEVVLGFDITPAFFTFSGILLFFGLYYYKLFDLSPFAWETIMENLDEGVILFNKYHRVVDVNSLFGKILGIQQIKIGAEKDYLLSKYPQISIFCDSIIETADNTKEVIINKEGKRCYLKLVYSVLYDKRHKSMLGYLLIVRDVTAEKISAEKLNEAKNLLSDIIDFLPDPTIAIDLNGKVIAWSKSMEELSGVAKKDIIGKGDYIYSVPFYGKARPMLVDFVLNRDLKIKKYYDKLELNEDKIIAEVLVKNDKKNIEAYFWTIASPLYGSDGKLIGAIESIRDVTERKNLEDKLTHISFHDSLTGLYNRAFFEEELKRLDSDRYIPISIIMTDLNGLKLVNDAFGHQYGDNLLKQAAEVIKNYCRKSDIVARWGGDEYIILLPKTDQAYAEKIIQRIKNACGKTAELKIPLNIAIGCATKNNNSVSLESILKKAEDQMYRNKLLEAKSVQNQIIQSLTKALYEKNIETENHSNRVIDLAMQLGKKLKLPNDRMDELILHAKLHDIGKVSIDENILKKKTRLAAKEWKVIKKHSEAGYRIASSSTLLAPIAEYILAQHEWWNGKGYPRKLKGEQIPLISRIVAIIDAYDAMVNERPYKSAKTKKEAIAEIEKFSGIQFDPVIAKEFIEIIK